MIRIRSVSRAVTAGLVLAVLTLGTSTLLAQRLVDLTGTWAFSVVTANGTGTPTVTLKQDGAKLTGTYTSSRMGTRPLSGSVKGDSVSFVLEGGEVPLTFMGVVVDANAMKGIVDFAGEGGATFTASRNTK